MSTRGTPQAKYWILTIPHAYFLPFKPNGVKYIRGQLERGEQQGYLHWQIALELDSKRRLSTVKDIFGDQCHAEPSRSRAVLEYVWKQDSRVDGTQFEIGERTLQRNRAEDWETIRDSAREGRLDDISAQIYVVHYNNLKRIAVDNSRPLAQQREVFVFWGPTGVGKSRRAWELAGLDAYPKDPNTKFWDGYRNHSNVVIDEFRGRIDVSHLLRWFDRYPVLVEVKGSAAVFSADKIFITSNLEPTQWYPELDQSTRDALLRRLTIYYCPQPLYTLQGEYIGL